MAKLTINRGSLANDGTGDNLRDGANKINLNFDEIYTAIGDGSTVDGTIKIADDSSTVATISANGETLRVLGGTAITSTLSGNTLTIAADTASLITASGSATLTNKTIDLTDNTITGTLSEFNTAVSDATLVSLTGSEILTNKTINAPDNTVTNISNTNLSGSAGITNANLANSSITITGDDSSAQSISLGDGILFTGGSGITTSVSGNEITFATDGSIVTETSTDTLTNKTINGPDNTLTNIANGSLVNSSITLGDDTISLGGTQTTITNLSLDGATGTIDLTSSGNKLRFNYAGTGSFPSESTYDGMFAYDTTGNEAYVADAGGWTKLLNENSSVSSHADVNITGIADGNVLVWSSAQGRFNAGSAASALTVQEEGSALTTAATTLNFVGSAVTASGTGTTKTITISDGGTDSAATIALMNAAGLNVPDNVNITAGADSDLKIYHDGSRSYISDQGTGELRILSSQLEIKNSSDDATGAVFTANGGASLYYNNSKKLETTDSGVNITGEITADSATISGLRYQACDGLNNQVIRTDGSGNLSFVSVAAISGAIDSAGV